MRIEELAKREIDKRKSESEDNRRRFPQCAAFKEACEKVFGRVKVIRCGNYETGEKAGAVDVEPWLSWPDFGKYGDSRQPFQSAEKVRRVRSK
jgi:hypothetical protein